jgi:hypothetical protein
MTEVSRKLGRRPPKNAPALELVRSLTGVVPHPATADHFGRVADFGLYGNDQYGDCGPVSVANYIKLVSLYLTGREVSVSQADVFDLYRRSGNPGFDPVTDAGDNGVDMQTMLEALTRGGIGGGHRPVAFAKVNVTSPVEIQSAIAIFGGVLFGVTLDVAQQTQTDAGGPWDYTRSAVWGGHAVVAGQYTGAITGPDISVVSWAQVLGTTDAFLAHQLDEAWVVIFPEHLGTTAFVEGVDVATLAADYQALTGRSFPAPPPPVPSPPPVDLDHALAAVFRADGWIDRHHVGDNAHVQRAAKTWLEAKGI